MGIIFTLTVGYASLYFLKRRTIKKYFREYQDAIHSGDKGNALYLGRRYYARIRGGVLGRGQLTIYDEQAITNDLTTMK